jgi:hypothetical protein
MAPRCQFAPPFRKGATLPELGAAMAAAPACPGPSWSGNQGVALPLAPPFRKAPRCHWRRRSDRRRAAIRAAVPKGAALPELGAVMAAVLEHPGPSWSGGHGARAANSRRRFRRRRAAIRAAVPKGAGLPESDAPSLAPGCI